MSIPHTFLVFSPYGQYTTEDSVKIIAFYYDNFGKMVCSKNVTFREPAVAKEG